jgi:hypothetical protein
MKGKGKTFIQFLYRYGHLWHITSLALSQSLDDVASPLSSKYLFSWSRNSLLFHNPKVFRRHHKNVLLDSNVVRSNPVHIFTDDFSNIDCCSTLPSTAWYWYFINYRQFGNVDKTWIKNKNVNNFQTAEMKCVKSVKLRHSVEWVRLYRKENVFVKYMYTFPLSFYYTYARLRAGRPGF